jgi:hypothetical protein
VDLRRGAQGHQRAAEQDQGRDDGVEHRVRQLEQQDAAMIAPMVVPPREGGAPRHCRAARAG